MCKFFLVLYAIFICSISCRASGKVTFSKLAIGYAGASMQSPESIFGHIFLVFYNEEFPNFSSVVISYVANTENMSKGTEYLYNGIFSKFKSVIVIDNFSQIFFKYHLEQRRELFFYELSVDQYEVDNMYESLSKNKYILNNYNFFTNNCVNGIDFVLKYFLNDENTPKESVFYTPFEFLEDYRKILTRPKVFGQVVNFVI